LSYDQDRSDANAPHVFIVAWMPVLLKHGHGIIELFFGHAQHDFPLDL
jgi:hypothetical protein